MRCKEQPNPVPIENGTLGANGLTTFHNVYVMDIPSGGSHVRSLDTRYPALDPDSVEVTFHVNAHHPTDPPFNVTNIKINRLGAQTQIAFHAQRSDGTGTPAPGCYCLDFTVIARVI